MGTRRILVTWEKGWKSWRNSRKKERRPKEASKDSLCLLHSSADSQLYPQFYKFYSSSALTWLHIRAVQSLSQKWYLKIFVELMSNQDVHIHLHFPKDQAKLVASNPFLIVERGWTLNEYVKESMNQLSWWYVQSDCLFWRVRPLLREESVFLYSISPGEIGCG